MPSGPAGLTWPLPAGDKRVTGGHGATGSRLEVLVAGQRIAGPGVGTAAGTPTVDLSRYVLLPAPAEPHAHLDKALLAGRAHNRSGDLAGALAAMREIYATMTVEDIHDRARRAATAALQHGFTAVRTHVDVGSRLGTRGVEALVMLRRELGHLVDIQVVAFVTEPVTGEGGAAARRYAAMALEAGADLIGGAPWLNPEPEHAVDVLTAAAADCRCAIDMHCDETTDPGVLSLRRYIDRVEQLGLGGRATASHCVSLGQQPLEDARYLARALAETGIAVVTLPQTNLMLQGRSAFTGALRGMAPLKVLEEAGVLVAAGGDNYRDPFNPLGRADPMETAALAVAAGHLSPARAYAMVSERARAVMGLPPAALRAGDAADFLAIAANDLDDAVAGGSDERIVFHRGEVVSWSEVVRHLAPPAQAVTAPSIATSEPDM